MSDISIASSWTLTTFPSTHHLLFLAIMQIKSLLFAALAVSGAAAQRACGAPEPTQEQIATAKAFLALEQEARLAGNFSAAAASIEVNVYFHVVASSKTTAGGYLSVSKLWLPADCTMRPSTTIVTNIKDSRLISAPSSMP